MLMDILSPELLTFLGWLVAHPELTMLLVVGLVAGCDCCDNCTVYSDDFSADYLSGNEHWQAITGAATVTGGELQISANNSKIADLDAHPDSISSSVVTVDVKGASGDKPRIIVDWNIGADTYHFVEITIGTASGCVTLNKRSGGSNKELARTIVSLAASTYQTVEVYFDGVATNAFTVVIGSVTLCINDITPLGGTYVGVGSGNPAASIAFDNWTFAKHYQSGDSAECAQVTCSTDPCIIGSDNFNRSDSSDLSCPWSIVAGSPDINSSLMRFTGSSSSARYVLGNAAEGTMSASAICQGATSGDQPRIHIGVDSSLANGWYAQLTIGTSQTLKIFTSAGSQLATTTISTSTSTNYTLHVCLGSGFVRASLLSGSTILATVRAGISTPSPTRYCGLGCGTVTSSVTFDNFSFSHYTSGCPGCEVIATDCSVCCLPGTGYTITIPQTLTDAGSSCSLCSNFHGDFVCDNHVGGVNSCKYTCCTGTPVECCTFGGSGPGCSSGPDASECACWPLGCYFVTAEAKFDGSNKCYLRVTMWMVVNCGEDCGFAVMAAFESAHGIEFCDGNTITCPSVSDACTGNACGGSLPSSVTATVI